MRSGSGECVGYGDADPTHKARRDGAVESGPPRSSRGTECRVTEEQLNDGPVLDSTTPNTARIWDYQLGGKDNFEADRHATELLNKACRDVGAPDGRDVARVNRAFLRRAVRYLADSVGIDQFLDLGAGLPTRGNVHEIARQMNPDARTVYVDYDPMVLAHARALLADNVETIAIQADVREPDAIVGDPELRAHLDLDRPVAVLFVAVLHLMTDD